MKPILQLFFIALSLFPLISCTGAKTVAVVGEKKITQKDVVSRAEMLKLFNPQINEKAALEQLIRSAAIVEILKSKGVSVEEKLLDQEVNRLQTAGKNNPQLEKLLNHFGSKTSFKELYVLPVVAEQLAFREAYQKDEAFQKEEKEKAEKLLANATKNPAKLETFAKELGVPVIKGTHNEKEGLVWDGAGRHVANMPPLPSGIGFGQMWKKTVLEKTAPGKMISQVEPIGHLMAIVRNDGNSKGTAKFTAAFIMKRNFGDWLNQNQQYVQVTRME